jgi:Pectate lyase superfamily protein
MKKAVLVFCSFCCLHLVALAQVSIQTPIPTNGVTGNWSVPGTEVAGNGINKLPRVDVRHPDFGKPSGCGNPADPTGTNPSDCAIQAAIDWSMANPQGKGWPSIYIPAGTYKLTKALRVPCQLRLVGDGNSVTVLEPAIANQNGVTVYTKSGAPIPNAWICGGSIEDLTIHAPAGHLYTATLIELQNAVGYSISHIRGSNGGGRGLVMLGNSERVKVIDTEWDTIRWPIVALGNELRFLDTSIASAGMDSTGWCMSPNNCVNGVPPGNQWTVPQQLTGASGSGTAASYLVTGGSDSMSTNGISPLVAGHWFTVEGIHDITGLNGVYQITKVFNNCKAVANGSCSTPSATQYIVFAANTSTGTSSANGATFKPTMLPERNGAFTFGGAAISILGGSIKANWYSGCFSTNETFSGLIEGFYCEGFPINHQPHLNSDLQMAGLPWSTTLTSAVSENVASIANNQWSLAYVNDPADAPTLQGLIVRIMPPDYSHTPTSKCSASVTTPSGGCVSQSQYEQAVAITAGDGTIHFSMRNYSGSNLPPNAGTIVWPPGSIVSEAPEASYGSLTVIGSHFSSVNPVFANTGWAADCDDQTALICGTVVIGGIPNGYTTFPAAGSPPGGSVTFIDVEWWGLGGPANENTGQQFVKVVGVGDVTVINGGQHLQALGETSEAASGKMLMNSSPSVYAVPGKDGTPAYLTYSNPTSDIYVNTTRSTYRARVNGFNDPVLGANPRSQYALGFQFAGSSCDYDTPAAGASHAAIRHCVRGGPAFTGTGVGWEDDVWNPATSQWVSALNFSGNAGANGGLLQMPGNSRAEFDGPVTLNGGMVVGSSYQGRATLTAGTAAVPTTAITAASNVTLTNCGARGTAGILSLGPVVAGSNFVIKSSSEDDTSIVCWWIH